MRALLAGLLFLAVAAGTRPAFAAATLDAETIRYLEGVWLIGRAPPTGDCVDNSYLNYQLEFEFERTGGRVLSYEPYDLFGAVPILAAERNGDTVALTISTVPPVNSRKVALRVLGPDRMELTMEQAPQMGPSKPLESQMLYRCGGPDKAFSRGVSTDVLRVLTNSDMPNRSFVEVEPGRSDLDACTPKHENGIPLEPHWIWFEVFGPAHFFVMGSLGRVDADVRRQLDLSPLVAIRSTGEHSLRLDGLERLEGGHGWNGGSQVKPFHYDIDWSGDHIHIAQLDASFVDCGAVRATAPASPPR